MGPLIALLTKMGLQNISYELITDVMTFKDRPRKPKSDVATISPTDALVAYATKHPAFKIADAIKKLEDGGVDTRTIFQVAGALVRKKLLKKVMAGSYQFIGRASIAKSGPTKTKRGRASRLGISNKEFLWTEFKDRNPFSAAEVAEHFKTHDRNVKSASSTLSQLFHGGFLERRDDGLYVPIGDKGPPYKSSAGLNDETPAATEGAADHG